MSGNEPVHTLEDLEHWPAEGTWLAVLGHPIAHSISPDMHNAALKSSAALDTRYAAWRYVRFDVPPERLPEALTALRAKGFLGLNLTVPHKVMALPHVARVAPEARAIGAVNTLRACAEGWEGFNTDGHGLAAGVRKDLGLGLQGAHVLLLGAGGAARGAAVECLLGGVASLHIANRSAENLQALLADLAPLRREGVLLRGFAPREVPSDLPASCLVINATSAGLKAGDPLPIELERLPRPAAIYDMIYNPARTPLLLAAERAGIPVANGLSMLVNQGAKALSLWTGLPAENLAPDMDKAAQAAMRR